MHRRDARTECLAAAFGAAGSARLRAEPGADKHLPGLVDLCAARARAARDDLTRALRLARALEVAATDGSPCVRGLITILETLSGDLESRARWSEQSLFPRLLGGGADSADLQARLCERQATARPLLDALHGAVRDRQASGRLCVAGQECLWVCCKAEWALGELSRVEARLLAAAGRAGRGDDRAPRPRDAAETARRVPAH